MSASPLAPHAVQLRPEDNVAIAAHPLAAGQEFGCNGSSFRLSRRIGMGHKFALQPIPKGEAVHKYGQIIGFASEDIAAGDHVHVHNVARRRLRARLRLLPRLSAAAAARPSRAP